MWIRFRRICPFGCLKFGRFCFLSQFLLRVNILLCVSGAFFARFAKTRKTRAKLSDFPTEMSSGNSEYPAGCREICGRISRLGGRVVSDYRRVGRPLSRP